jgi:hypothetical protein
MPIQNLSQLAAELSTYAKIIQDQLEGNNHAGLSLDANAPIEFPLDLSNPAVQDARTGLIKTSKLIHDLTSGPKDLIMELCVNVGIKMLSPQRPHSNQHERLNTI